MPTSPAPTSPGQMPPSPNAAAPVAAFRWFRLHGVLLSTHETRPDGKVWHCCVVEASDAAPGVLGARGLSVQTRWQVWKRYSHFEALSRRVAEMGVKEVSKFPAKRLRLDQRRKGLEAWSNSVLDTARESASPGCLRSELLEFFQADAHPPRAAEQRRLAHFRLCALDLIGDDARRTQTRSRFTMWRRWATCTRRRCTGCRLIREASELRLRASTWRAVRAYAATAPLRRLRALLGPNHDALEVLLGRRGSGLPDPTPSASPAPQQQPSLPLSVAVPNSICRVTGAFISRHRRGQDGSVVFYVDVEAADPAPSALSVPIRSRWRVVRRFHQFSDLKERVGHSGGGSFAKFPSQVSGKHPESRVESCSRDMEAWLNSIISAARERLGGPALREHLDTFLETASHPSKHESPAQLRDCRLRVLQKLGMTATRRGGWERWRRYATGRRLHRLLTEVESACTAAGATLGAPTQLTPPRQAADAEQDGAVADAGSQSQAEHSPPRTTGQSPSPTPATESPETASASGSISVGPSAATEEAPGQRDSLRTEILQEHSQAIAAAAAAADTSALDAAPSPPPAAASPPPAQHQSIASPDIASPGMPSEATAGPSAVTSEIDGGSDCGVQNDEDTGHVEEEATSESSTSRSLSPSPQLLPSTPADTTSSLSHQRAPSSDSCLWTRQQDIRYHDLMQRVGCGVLTPSEQMEFASLQKRYDEFSERGLMQMMSGKID